MNRVLFRLVLLAIVLPLKLSSAEKYEKGASDPDGIVRMKPFKVMSEWMEIRPMLQRGIVQFVTIRRVTPKSPVEAAGIKPGSVLVTLQGIHFRGLTQSAFNRTLDTLPGGNWLELGVADPPRKGVYSDSFRVIRLPLEKIEQLPEIFRVPSLN
jgi:hypothetical protein